MLKRAVLGARPEVFTIAAAERISATVRGARGLGAQTAAVVRIVKSARR
jgi:hypothetical protein